VPLERLGLGSNGHVIVVRIQVQKVTTEDSTVVRICIDRNQFVCSKTHTQTHLVSFFDSLLLLHLGGKA
jgi:hypothetical protein